MGTSEAVPNYAYKAFMLIAARRTSRMLFMFRSLELLDCRYWCHMFPEYQ